MQGNGYSLEYSLKCKTIVGGTAKGMILLTTQPINFLSSVDNMTGKITDKNHELFGKFLKGNILIFPYSVGSSVGAYSIFALKSNKAAPSGIICSLKTDITTASGCAISNIPLLELCKDQVIPEIEIPSQGVIDGSLGFLQIKKV
jgi:predicted aconitase with swiveling domain